MNKKPIKVTKLSFISGTKEKSVFHLFSTNKD